MKFFNCFKDERSKKRCRIIIMVVILMMIVGGWIMIYAGCEKRRIDFRQNYYFCEEIGDQRVYYGGLLLIFLGVMSLFGWIFSFLVIAKPRANQGYHQSAPPYGYNAMDNEPLEIEPLNPAAPFENKEGQQTQEASKIVT